MILKWIFGDIRWCGLDWIDLAEDTDQYRTVCELGNEPLGFIKCWEMVAAQLAASQEGLRSMELVTSYQFMKFCFIFV
jgi:hypothetical protein